MSKIKLVIDSTSDISPDILRKYDVSIAPLSVFFGDKGYRDGIDITPKTFYPMLREFEGFPTTSQVNPQAFKEIYTRLSEEADTILSMHFSGKLSGTFASAQIAAKELEWLDIVCYDSESASLGYGFQVLEAIKAIEEGCTIKQVLERVTEIRDTMHIYFAVASLEHLRKGGRIGKATAFLGGLLNIVPLLTLEDGIVAPYEKIRGKKKVPTRFLELLDDGIKKYGGKDNIKVSVLHSENLEGANELADEIRDRFGIEDILITQVGTIIGTHIGSGVSAIIFHKKVS